MGIAALGVWALGAIAMSSVVSHSSRTAISIDPSSLERIGSDGNRRIRVGQGVDSERFLCDQPAGAIWPSHRPGPAHLPASPSAASLVIVTQLKRK